MTEEIREDNNCIVKAFENNPISIITEEIDNKKLYCFKASDIGKALNIVNIRTSIMNFDGDEVVVRTTYDTIKRKQETLFLTSQGVYRLLYNSKKEVAKKFRKWAGNILDDIIFNESVELKRQLEEIKKEKENKHNQLQLLELQNKEKQDKINLLTRKTNKFEPGESVYIFHSTISEDSQGAPINTVINLYKVGRTKNANGRDAIHKTASYKGILLQVKCVDCVLLERVVHFLLNKYRCANRREWFDCSYDIIKNSIYYAKLVLESEIDFENIHLISDTTDFIDTIKNEDVDLDLDLDKIGKEKEGPEPSSRNYIKTLEFTPNDINDFEKFLSENCENNDGQGRDTLSYTTLKNQYKIWAKTANHSQLKKMIDYVKTRYTTSMKKYNPLVSTSKLTQHFNGIKLKDSLLKFEKPSDNFIIERFLYEKCQRAPGYRITMQEFFSEFEEWYIVCTKHNSEKLTNVIKEKLKSYLDIQFIRLRTGDESNGVDNRLGGWLGFALKTNNIPEPIKKYKPKNAKKIIQKNVTTNEIIKEWPSVSELSDYIKKSRSVTSLLIKRHEQIYIDNILSTLEIEGFAQI
jgi:prophage antirepressor-like protein